jgi:CO/xanthine dehydrogenase Mo-binding subunit
VVAADVEIVTDGGAYIYTSTKVMGNATLMCTGPYDIPNVKVDSYAVYTNNLPNGAFRGFGGPQGAFEAESQMNKLAEKLGMDPVEIRMRNIFHEGTITSVGTPIPPGVTMDKVLTRCAADNGWQAGKAGWQRPAGFALASTGKTKRGLGLAISYKNIGFSFGAPEQCTATIEVKGKGEIDEVILHHAGAEVGQGSHTVFKQMTADACGVPLEKVRLDMSDTATSGSSGSVSASRMTFMAGNAIRGAAELALEKWKGEERPASATFVYRPPKTTPYDPETGKCEPNYAYGYTAELVEAAVDTETGLVTVEKVVCVDDVGHAINPALVQGQVEGAIVQASGYGVMENFIQKDGKVLTPTLSTYLIPTVLDIPGEVESVILEYPDPRGPWGARGVGEMPYLPFVPALTAALHAATGVWFDEFPLTPQRVLEGLGEL